MAWNDSGNGKDPWKRDDDAPTDLDQIVRNWQRKLKGITGGRGGGGGAGASAAGGWVLVMMLVVAWLATGIYIVDAAERGVVQRFGRYVETTEPGFRWHMPFPIETVDVVNTSQVDNYSLSTEILTADESYVHVQVVVQYRRTDPVAYSFNVVGPDETLQHVTESALREVVGTSSLEVLVTERRGEIAPRTQAVLQSTLDAYGAGIEVTSTSLADLDYPEAVQLAVDDAQKARNDAERIVFEADRYAQDLIPRARGRAARILQDAEAYRDRVIAGAEGAASRFSALLTEYQKAPRVTRERLYIDAVQDVYSKSTKVILDSQGSGNLLYLPIDQLIRQGRGRQLPAENEDSLPDGIPNDDAMNNDATDRRPRRTRQ